MFDRAEKQSEKVPNVCADLMNHSKPLGEQIKHGSNEALNSTLNLLERKRREAAGGTLEVVQRPHVLTVEQARQIEIDVLYARRPGIPRSVVRKDRKRFHRILTNHPTSAQLRYVMMYMDSESEKKNMRPFKSRGYETKSTWANKATRNKRQAERVLNPDRYTSPCYEQTEFSTNPRVLNIDNTVGELYFFEGKQQVKIVNRKFLIFAALGERREIHPIISMSLAAKYLQNLLFLLCADFDKASSSISPLKIHITSSCLSISPQCD